MKYPHTVKIGAHLFSLDFKPYWEGADEEVGYTHFEKREILIQSGLAESQKFSKVLHEALHVMNGTLNHELLDSISEQMAQFLIDNGLVEL